MHANPSALDTRSLTAALRSSAGEERDRQVDFLRYLDPFDAREAYREAGYDSLWQFCLRELSLREGAAGRRIGAMRVLRQFPHNMLHAEETFGRAYMARFMRTRVHERGAIAGESAP